MILVDSCSLLRGVGGSVKSALVVLLSALLAQEAGGAGDIIQVDFKRQEVDFGLKFDMQQGVVVFASTRVVISLFVVIMTALCCSGCRLCQCRNAGRAGGRTVATQSQTTYRLDLATARFQVLAEREQGAFDH